MTDASEGKLKSKRRKPMAIAITGVALAAVIGGTFWLTVKAGSVKDELESAANIAPKLKDEVLQGNSGDASDSLSQLKGHTAAARNAVSDPLWTVASALPWVGPNFEAVSALATSADDVVRLGADPIVSVVSTLDWDTLIPSQQGVNLGPLVAAKPKLAAAADAVRRSADKLNEIDAGTLVPQISAPLVSVREQLDSVRIELDLAADTATIAPGMMGSAGPRRYLLLIQNNAEARATGGIPGALAVMNIDRGKLTLDAQTSATALGTMSPGIPVDPEQQRIYSGRIGKFMQDVNLTPDFPTSASAAVSMWQQKTGERLDGVVSIDPVALSYMLRATGPVTVSDPHLQELVTGTLPARLDQSNVVKTLLSDVYTQVPEPALQDLYFARVAEQIFEALSSSKNDNTKFLEGLSQGVGEGRVLLWSAERTEQSVIGKYSLGGSISGGSISPSQFGVYFNDGTGAKMDFYVKRTVQLVKECTGDGYSRVKARIMSTNTVPKDAAERLPAYVTGGGLFGVPAGSVQTNVVAYGPLQSNVDSASRDGKKTGFSAQHHAGRPVGAVTIRLAPGQSSTIEFTFDKIVQSTAPQLSVTPTVQALKDVVLATQDAQCAPAA
jgi:hypothetical protein